MFSGVFSSTIARIEAGVGRLKVQNSVARVIVAVRRKLGTRSSRGFILCWFVLQTRVRHPAKADPRCPSKPAMGTPARLLGGPPARHCTPLTTQPKPNRWKRGALLLS